jgi:hypothetical protein
MLWGPPIYRRPWRPMFGFGWGLLALIPMLFILGLVLVGGLLRAVF